MGGSIPRPHGTSETTRLKPYPLVSDLWEPARRVAMPRAWWLAKNWHHVFDPVQFNHCSAAQESHDKMEVVKSLVDVVSHLRSCWGELCLLYFIWRILCAERILHSTHGSCIRDHQRFCRLVSHRFSSRDRWHLSIFPQEDRHHWCSVESVAISVFCVHHQNRNCAT